MFKGISRGLAAGIFILSLGLFFDCRVQAEENITFTTYYPSPSGVYKGLRLAPLGSPPASCQEGEIYYDDSIGEEKLKVCDNTSNWVPLTAGGSSGVYWKDSGDNIYNAVNLNTGHAGAACCASGPPIGHLYVNDAYLRDAGKWASDYIKACHWKVGFSGGFSNPFLYNSETEDGPGGKVGIGTNTPDARLTVKDDASSIYVLYVDYDGPSYAALSVKDDGSVGLGTNSPTAKLEVVGNIRIADASEGTDRLLTSDSTGLATWQTPAQGDTRPPQGLYGYCEEPGSPPRCNYDDIASLPASCGNTNRCECPATYDLVETDNPGPRRYTCYKR